MLNGLANFHGKHRDQNLTETNENVCGGSCTHLNECSFSEIQMLYKEVVVDKNFNKKVTTVKFPMIKYSSLVRRENYEFLSEFNLDVEGRSFASNKNIREDVPSIMKLLKLCVIINHDIK